MSRDPNDDRSDTMNPNNDAYWADQENRFGDDDGGWEDESSPGSPDNAASTARSRDLALTATSSPWVPTFSGRQRCGPLVMDRASHFLWAVRQIADCIVGHKVEVAQSIERRAAHVKELHRVSTDIRASERDGRFGSEFKKMEANGHRRAADVDEDLLANYEACLLASVGWVEAYGYSPFPLLRPDATPRPERAEVGWRRGLDLLCSSLPRGLKAAGVGDGKGWGDCAVIYTISEEATWRSEEPGTLGSELFPTEDAMYEWEMWLDRNPSLQMASYPSRSYNGDWSYSHPKLRIFPLLFPSSRSEGGASLTEAGCSRLLAALRWLVDPFADWWDIRPTIEAARVAVAEAEWAGLPCAVFGVRIDQRQDVRGGIASVCSSVGARSRTDAAAQSMALARKGFRAVLLPTRVVPGRATWLRPVSPDGYQEIRLVGSDEFWLVNAERGRKVAWDSADAWIDKTWGRR